MASDCAPESVICSVCQRLSVNTRAHDMHVACEGTGQCSGAYPIAFNTFHGSEIQRKQELFKAKEFVYSTH